MATQPQPLELRFDFPTAHRYFAVVDILTSLPAAQASGLERIDAFEDHEHFAYVFGTSSVGDRPVSAATENRPSLHLRRIFFIRPNLIVIDDQVATRRAGEIAWMWQATGKLELLEGELRGIADGVRYRCRAALPQNAAWIVGRESDGPIQATQLLSTSADESNWVRSLHVVSFAEDSEPALPKSNIERLADGVRLELGDPSDDAQPGRITHLWLPDGATSGRIEIVRADGGKVLASRLLPAGIFPPDVDGARRRLQWDLPYQTGDHTVWDTGRPSSELKRFVESGQIKPCRTVELGCGTGSDAIFLAQNGFDVTAIDISPTALNIAQRKAEKAGVKVNWLLADVLHPPKSLKPFDFAYDRGCYHEVRQHHARQYVDALKKLTHAGTKTLILAGNANKDTYWRFEGPPRVREQDLRADFANGFRLVHLREFRFDPAPPEKQGALAWSILLERRH